VSCLDGQDVFGSGPHSFHLQGWQRALQRRGFPGVHGEVLLDLGRRSRVILQSGRLQAATAEQLYAQIEQVQEFDDAGEHVLIDNHGRTHSRVVVEHFEMSAPVRIGRGAWCDYQIRYRHLP